MRRSLYRLIAFSCCLALLLASAAQGQHGAKTEHGPHKVKYKALLEAEGHEEEKGFDLSNQAQAAELVRLLSAGKIQKLELAEDKAVNPLAIKSDLGIWTLVVFGLLLFILKKLAWGPMLEGLQKREASIKTAADEAKKAREETEQIRAQFKKDLAKAYEEIPQIMDKARRNAQSLADEMRAKAQTEIQAERQRLRREIDTARDQALQEIWSQTAQLATQISAKALRREVNQDDHRRLVDEALVELQQSRERRQREVAIV